MTAITKAEIGEIVRKLLAEEQHQAEVSLKAMQRLSSLLVEEVIPRLAGETSEEDEGARLALSRSSARAINVRPGVRIGPTGKLLVRILEAYPKKNEIYITSGYRPGAGSHHGGLTYGGSPTAAIDIGGAA